MLLAGTGSWRGRIIASSMSRGAVFVGLLLDCHLPACGTLIIGRKDDLIRVLAEQAQLEPSRVSTLIEEIKKAEFLSSVRLKDGTFRLDPTMPGFNSPNPHAAPNVVAIEHLSAEAINDAVENTATWPSP